MTPPSQSLETENYENYLLPPACPVTSLSTPDSSHVRVVCLETRSQYQTSAMSVILASDWLRVIT